MWARRFASVQELDAARALSAQPGFAWLDSNRTESRDGRFSFLAARPTEEIRVAFGDPAPFSDLDRVGCASEPSTEGPRPSEVPSWIGYVAYDAFWSAPTRGRPRFERGNEPVLLFRRYPALLAIDHESGDGWIVGDDRAACDELESLLQADACERGSARPDIGHVAVDDARLHREAIATALGHIADGEVYEVNLARRWSASFHGDPLALWQAMRVASRVPLGLFLDGGDHAVLACTMERFIHWDATSRRLVTRPIKGTIRREPTDDRASERLRADPKERAEHSMIVDLMRNDLGRVAETGSVRVEAPMVVEPFTGLYHLVSTVSCTTRPEVTLQQILQATFPPGSVTGAPKLRALELIENLEQHPRGIYCGALGFIDREGGVSLAVAIRTATVRDGRVCYWAGGGIVEASDPDREVAETELKAKVFLDAVESLRGGIVDEAEEILSFWFGELDAQGCARREHRERWWSKSEGFDRTVRSRFSSAYDAIVAKEREDWRRAPRTALAYIIVLDQFSRNMFRGTPKMFEADPLAREVCREGIDAGFDAELALDERLFFYLPLEHSEDIRDHEQCLAMFRALCDTASESSRSDAEYYLDFAERHRAIVERFGRYPHRNELLGRPSTEEELEFLAEPGSSF